MVQDTTGTFHPCQARLSLTRYILAEDAESLPGQEEVMCRVKHQEMLFDPREQTQCISFLSFCQAQPRPANNWDPGILDPEEHLTKSLK